MKLPRWLARPFRRPSKEVRRVDTDRPKAARRRAYRNRPMGRSDAHDLVIDAALVADSIPVRELLRNGDGYDAIVPVEMLRELYLRGVEHGQHEAR